MLLRRRRWSLPKLAALAGLLLAVGCAPSAANSLFHQRRPR